MQGTDAQETQEAQKIQVRGLKHFRTLLPLFARLREVGTKRDKAHNRKLFFDQYVSLVMLYLFNPLIASLRTLQQVLGLENVAKTLGIKRFSLGSFSEAPAVFEPKRLKEVITELAGQVRPLAKDPRLADVKQALTLVDGTMLKALPKIAQAAANGTCYATGRDGKKKYAWRLHTQLDLSLPQPLHMDLTGASKAGENGEREVFAQKLEAGRCYVHDAGYRDYRLFDQIVDADSSYVSRVQENIAFDAVTERELSDEARKAGIVRDVLIEPRRTGSSSPKHPVRLIFIRVTPRTLRTRKATKPGVKIGSRVSDRLTIATNLLDLPAELVGLIYRQRYSIELFFRFFKGLLGMRHLLSQRKEGVEIQTCCAVIACLLIHLETGKKPDKRMVEMLGFYMIGLASEEEVIAFLNKPDNTGVKIKAREELFKKLGI